jgi:hypothetical protein
MCWGTVSITPVALRVLSLSQLSRRLAVRVHALVKLIHLSFALPSFTMETSILRHCDELKVSPVLFHHLPSHEFPLLISQTER